MKNVAGTALLLSQKYGMEEAKLLQQEDKTISKLLSNPDLIPG
jgi:hypothetical protein